MICRGVRGATTANSNSRDDILTATRQLLALMIRINGIEPEHVASAIFSLTRDLDAEFPALAARQLGWLDVPLLCGHDMDVQQPNPRGVPRCIRIALLYNTDRAQSEMRHAYLRGAEAIQQHL